MLGVMPSAEAAPAVARGRYLYAIVDGPVNPDPMDFGGIDGGQVYALGDGRIAAVVSDLPDRKIRPERRKLAAHHEVMRRLMAERTVLPMAFGLIADGPESVQRILRLNHEAFEEQLDRLRRKVEMGLRVTWDVPEHLRIHRDQARRAGRLPRPDLPGRARALAGREDRAGSRLRPHAQRRPRGQHRAGPAAPSSSRCDAITVNKPRDERDVMNLACLVDRDRIKEFETGVLEAARGFNNDYAFDFNGPWPPHNFVEHRAEARLNPEEGPSVFLADDVILFPFKSILKVFKEIYKAAIEEIKSEDDSIRLELSQLYLALESGDRHRRYLRRPRARPARPARHHRGARDARGGRPTMKASSATSMSTTTSVSTTNSPPQPSTRRPRR